jgi:hypothetical protein
MNRYEENSRVSIFLLENASGKLRPLRERRFAEVLRVQDEIVTCESCRWFFALVCV